MINDSPVPFNDPHADTIEALGRPLLLGRPGSLAKATMALAAEVQLLRRKAGLPPLGVERPEARAVRWAREYPEFIRATAPGAAATAPAATKPAPTSASKTPTWDAFNALPEREKQAFYEQHKADLADEQRRVAAKGGAR